MHWWPQKAVVVTAHSLPGQAWLCHEQPTRTRHILPTPSSEAQIPLPSHAFQINRPPLLCCPVSETQLQHCEFPSTQDTLLGLRMFLLSWKQKPKNLHYPGNPVTLSPNMPPAQTVLTPAQGANTKLIRQQG